MVEIVLWVFFSAMMNTPLVVDFSCYNSNWIGQCESLHGVIVRQQIGMLLLCNAYKLSMNMVITVLWEPVHNVRWFTMHNSDSAVCLILRHSKSILGICNDIAQQFSFALNVFVYGQSNLCCVGIFDTCSCKQGFQMVSNIRKLNIKTLKCLCSVIIALNEMDLGSIGSPSPKEKNQYKLSIKATRRKCVCNSFFLLCCEWR